VRGIELNEMKLGRTEMSMIRFTLKERNKSTELRELFGLVPVSLVIKEMVW